jgi:cytochrome c peroxidase
VAPPTANLEMAFFDRPFPLVGRKLLNVIPLGQQQVDPTDSVLGIYARPLGMKGLLPTYGSLIQLAFQPQYWNSIFTTPQGYSLMEANFSLFFGMAVQMYEETTVSNDAPFDRFMEGDNTALDQTQLQGLTTFLNRGRNSDGTSRNPAAEDAVLAAYQAQGVTVGAGNCVSCHSGPEFTRAAFTSLMQGGHLQLIQETASPVMVNGVVEPGTQLALSDKPFSSLGVRPIGEDLGRGGTQGGYPLSFTRQALDPNLNFLLPPGATLPCTRGVNCPSKIQIDGTFKIPGLRNVELTGPYLHTGGAGVLPHVFQLYLRRGDFSDQDIATVDNEMGFINLTPADAVIRPFLFSLTDPRVRNEQAPFDHPELTISGGGTYGAPLTLLVPGVGAGGRPAKGLPPLQPFLPQ